MRAARSRAWHQNPTSAWSGSISRRTGEGRRAVTGRRLQRSTCASWARHSTMSSRVQRSTGWPVRARAALRSASVRCGFRGSSGPWRYVPTRSPRRPRDPGVSRTPSVPPSSLLPCPISTRASGLESGPMVGPAGVVLEAHDRPLDRTEERVLQVGDDGTDESLWSADRPRRRGRLVPGWSASRGRGTRPRGSDSRRTPPARPHRRRLRAQARRRSVAGSARPGPDLGPGHRRSRTDLPTAASRSRQGRPSVRRQSRAPLRGRPACGCCLSRRRRSAGRGTDGRSGGAALRRRRSRCDRRRSARTDHRGRTGAAPRRSSNPRIPRSVV